MRFYLIGFMGSGKSRNGRKLAAALNYPFVDMDELMVEREGRTVAEIFETDGEARFRELERIYLHQTLEWEHAIIATGGGAPCFFDNINWMNRHGTTIFLNGNADILTHRLVLKPGERPLLNGKTPEELKQFIEQKLAARLPHYNKAHLEFTFVTGEEEPAESLAAYLKKLLR